MSTKTTDPMVARLRGDTAHGNIPFDVPFITHVEGNLYIGGCEDGLVLPEFIQHVISLYPWERYEVLHELRSFTEVRAYDDEPDEALFERLAEWAAGYVEDGPTLIHCQAGLNRSGLLTAMVLIRQGRTVAEAVSLLREKRSPAVLCNRGFERW